MKRYILTAVHPKYVPYPYQYKNCELFGYGPKRDSFATRLATWLNDNNMTQAELSRRCNQAGEKLALLSLRLISTRISAEPAARRLRSLIFFAP